VMIIIYSLRLRSILVEREPQNCCAFKDKILNTFQGYCSFSPLCYFSYMHFILICTVVVLYCFVVCVCARVYMCVCVCVCVCMSEFCNVWVFLVICILYFD
jgi:hypothetical protein